MTALELLKELERDYHLQLSGSRLNDIAERLGKWSEAAYDRGLADGVKSIAVTITTADIDAAVAEREKHLPSVPDGQGPDPQGALAAEQEIANATE